VWHKRGVKPSRRTPSPLTDQKLTELALRYVGKYATTRSKLRAYLGRKLRERGWNGDRVPDVEAIAERFARSGYIDDEAYALSKAQSLTVRGYGKRRVLQSLYVAGVEQEDSGAATDHADGKAVAAALRFAERRRLGPFAADRPADPREQEKALAAMLRAGHGFGLSRAILAMGPGEQIDAEDLIERYQPKTN
jgi:regulatory protein